MSAELRVEYDDPRETTRHRKAGALEKRAADNGLPVFNGESWEEHVSAWIQLEDVADDCSWRLASIAASLHRIYKSQAAEKFAQEVKSNKRTINLFSQVYRTFQSGSILPNLRWSHYLFATQYADDPIAAIEEASTKDWSSYHFYKVLRGLAQPELPAPAAPVELPEDRCQLIQSDVTDAASQIETESVDAIITDPPYPEEYLHVYEKLAALASEVLKPGGSLLVMVGQSYLPQILASMTPHIRYHWTVSYLTPGGQAAQLWQRKVNTFWKPVLWFVKGDYTGRWIGDVAKSAVNDNDKRFHEWGQSESGMADLIERFTQPGDLILDPFLGGGTTGVVALKLDRRFIGVDSDPAAIETAGQRIATDVLG
jgi:site-specific DNA-methyltransferase (adenine-specific)